jgi:hypothetical protein
VRRQESRENIGHRAGAYRGHHRGVFRIVSRAKVSSWARLKQLLDSADAFRRQRSYLPRESNCGVPYVGELDQTVEQADSLCFCPLNRARRQ